MDKNTLIGLGLIGTLLVTFTILNKPKELTDAINNKGKTEMPASTTDSKTENVNNSTAANSTTTDKKVVASSKPASSQTKTEQKTEIIRLETDKIIYDFSTKGGNLSAVYLKEFQTYFKTVW